MKRVIAAFVAGFVVSAVIEGVAAGLQQPQQLTPSAGRAAFSMLERLESWTSPEVVR